MSGKVKWTGMLGNCDLCQQPFGKAMYDCATRYGAWGNLCHSCWTAEGRPLGLGKGQKYKKMPDGTWEKVGG